MFKEKVKERFLKEIEQPKVVLKEDLVNFINDKGLKINKTKLKAVLIEEIIKEGHYEDLYEAFKDRIFIPSWEVADSFGLNTKQIDTLFDRGFIKEAAVEKNFLSKQGKFYTAKTYSIDILLNHTAEELEEIYQTEIVSGCYRIRVEASSGLEVYKLAEELEPHFRVGKIDVYPQRNKGCYGYFNLKKLSHSEEEQNAMLLEIKRLNKKIATLQEEIETLKSPEK